MKNYEVLESGDGRCPYCGSDFVMKVEKEEADRIRDRVPAQNPTIYKCYTCNKYFFMSS